MIVAGIDWADAHHDVHCCRETSDTTLSFRIGNDPEGFDELVQRIQSVQDSTEETVCVAVEHTEGLLIQRCLSEGYELYRLNPKMVARYRDQHRASRSKNDNLDAVVLAQIIRDHRDRFDPVRPDSELGRECQMLAQDYRKLTQDKSRLMNRITSGLKRYFPEALELFTSVDLPITLAFLEEFSTLEDAQTMSRSEWEQWLSNHRHPQPASKARTIHNRLHQHDPNRDPATIRAESRFVQRSVRQLQTVLETLDEFEQRFEEILTQHPDGEIFKQLPGASTVLAARMLGEFGDNRQQYDSANDVQCEAGTAPVTIQSGQSKQVVMRQACRRSFRDTMQQFAFTSINESKWARALYDRQRDRGKRHSHALRVVAHRWLSVIYTLWKKRECYDKKQHMEDSNIIQESAA